MTAKQFGALALISYAVVYLTNLIGLGINAAISALRGQQAGEPLQDMVTGTNPWIIFLFGVLLAPVVEEWIFRKLILRRLSPWGEPVAIFGSAFLFGLFHGNFGQFFYAFAVGAVFAYVALRTGGIRYTVALHFLVNLLGMTVAQAVEDSLVLSAIYGYLILAITVAGCVILWRHRKRIHLREGTSPIPAQEKRGLFLGNSGMIAMMVLSGILMLYVAFLA